MRLPKFKYFFLIFVLFFCFVNWQPIRGLPKNETNGLSGRLNQAVKQMTANKHKDPWPGKDKFQHFLVSAFLTGYTYLALKESLDVSKDHATVWGGSVSLSIGIGKEAFDLKSKKGHASFKDLLADVLGVASAVFFIQIL